jgi:hypothetical protein
VGPTALHERIGRALPQLGAALNATVELEFALVRLDRAQEGGAAVVPEAQAAALVDQAAQEGRLVRRRLSVTSTRPAVFVQGRWVDLLADYDCEVAQGAYVFDPRVLKAYLGTRLSARAAPAAGGIYLALLMRRTSGVGSVSERSLTRTARMSNERDMRVDEIDLVHQRLPILDHAVGLNTFLPEGQALVVAASQGRVDAHELLVVRRVGGSLPHRVTLSSGGGSGGLLLVDGNRWAPPFTSSWWGGLATTRAPRDPQRDGEPLSIDLRAPREEGLPVEEVLYDLLARDGGESWPIEILGSWLAIPADEGGALPDLERLVGHLAPDPRLVQVSLVLRSPAADAPVASLTLPLRAGLKSSAVLGVEDTYIGEAEVEIAQDASIEDPVLAALFDGLALEITPRLDVDGSLLLELEGQAAGRDRDPRKVDAGSGAVGEIEVASQRFLVIREQLRFPAGGGAPRATIGDLAGGLSLEVEVRF